MLVKDPVVTTQKQHRRTWLEELQYYFNTGIFHAGLRLEKLRKVAEGSPSRSAAECDRECSDLQKELAVCSAVTTALFAFVRQARPYEAETATS